MRRHRISHWSVGMALVIGLACAPLPANAQAWTKSGLWYEAGGRGPAVLLLHGSNLDHASMAPLARALARDHLVITTDLRFHGASRDGGGPVSFTDDVGEVLDAARARHAIVIGHSMGAQIAVDFALAHPERINSLVLIGPTVSGYAPKTPPPGLEDFIAALRKGDIDAAGRALAASPVTHLLRSRDRQDEVTAMIMRNLGLFRADRTRFAAPPAASGKLDALAMPVLVIVGEEDPTGALDVADFISSKLATARVVRLPDCGHLVPLDCPADAMKAIEGR
ncbi:MAG TPA: alpha/beta hydrolase [Dokdonella sp.]|nr:alpha/beta hydrolase [Dokdonella sp.]